MTTEENLMGWIGNLLEQHRLYVAKGEAERAAQQMYGNGQVAEDVTSGSHRIDELNGERYGTTLSDMMQRHGKVDWTMRDVLRSDAEHEDRLSRMDVAEEAQVDREVAAEIAAEDAEWARQDRLSEQRQEAEVMAMDWTPQGHASEPEVPLSPWDRAQAMGQETTAPAVDRGIEPA